MESMGKYLPITEEETEFLIKLSDRNNVARFSFGTGGVALEATPENAWALVKIARRRAEEKYRMLAHEHDF